MNKLEKWLFKRIVKKTISEDKYGMAYEELLKEINTIVIDDSFDKMRLEGHSKLMANVYTKGSDERCAY